MMGFDSIAGYVGDQWFCCKEEVDRTSAKLKPWRPWGTHVIEQQSVVACLPSQGRCGGARWFMRFFMGCLWHGGWMSQKGGALPEKACVVSNKKLESPKTTVIGFVPVHQNKTSSAKINQFSAFHAELNNAHPYMS